MSRRPAQHPYDFIREPFSASDLGIRAVTRIVPNRTALSPFHTDKASFFRVSVPFVSLIAPCVDPHLEDQHATGANAACAKSLSTGNTT